MVLYAIQYFILILINQNFMDTVNFQINILIKYFSFMYARIFVQSDYVNLSSV